MAFLHCATRLLRTRIVQNRTLNRQIFSTSYALCSNDVHEDFFGFGAEDSKELESQSHSKEIQGEEKFSIASQGNHETSTYIPPPDTDRVLVANFGTVRVDSIAQRDDFDHTPINRKSETKFQESSEIDVNYIDEQYFGDFARDAVHRFTRSYRSQPESESSSHDLDAESESVTENEGVEDLNYFDEVLVNMSASDIIRNAQSANSTDVRENLRKGEGLFQTINSTPEANYNKGSVIDNQNKSQDLSNLNYFDELLLKEPTSTIDPESDDFETKNVSTRDLDEDVEDLNYFDQMLINREPDQMKPTKAPEPKSKPTFTKSDKRHASMSTPEAFASENMQFVHDPKSKRKSATSTKPTANTVYESTKSQTLKEPPQSKTRDKKKQPETALEYAQQLRDETNPVKLDTHGFLILNQVKDLSQELSADVVDTLKKSIIHDDNDILAVNKPYGLATQDSKDDRHSTDSLLPQLAKYLRLNSGLYQVHRLDKNTTGVLLLAKTPAMQTRLINLFRKHEIVKKYWVLTKGVPDPTRGVIDVPMVEGTVQGRYRMTVSPEVPTERRRYSDKSSRAVTKYKVLDSNNSAALVECETVMGLKHQIRCHLGFVLNCPILGDHKYSHISKLAPQKLYPEILNHLGIRQSKVRHLPIHLHSSSVYIPKIDGDRGLFIKARLPSHFLENMKKLKLKVPKS